MELFFLISQEKPFKNIPFVLEVVGLNGCMRMSLPSGYDQVSLEMGQQKPNTFFNFLSREHIAAKTAILGNLFANLI